MEQNRIIVETTFVCLWSIIIGDAVHTHTTTIMIEGFRGS